MVTSTNLLRDVLFFIKNDLSSNVTDPISGSRTSGGAFVMTSYPNRAVQYPIITIKDNGISANKKLGMQSEGFEVEIPMEVRVWARNTKERDTIFTDVFERLRTNQFPESSSSTSAYADIHDFKLLNSINIDETGTEGIKSKILNVSYIFIIN